jgi:nitrous oxidase accessory protein
VVIPPGVYTEHIRIDKPLRLIGHTGPDSPGARPILDGGASGDIVEIAAENVEIRGFVIRNTGIDLDRENCAIRVLAGHATIQDNVLEDVLFGIDLKQAPDSVVRGNHIGGKKLDIARRGDGLRLWRCDRVLVENNTVHDGRDTILWYSTGVTVRGNRCERCRYGLHLMFSDDVTLEENLLGENSVGVYFMYSKNLVLRNNRLTRNRGPSGYGLGLKETDLYRVEGNVFVGNRVGVYLDGSPFTTQVPGRFEGNTFADNDVGMTFLPSVHANVITGNNFLDNIEQISVQGRGELTGNDFATDGRGNFWSDYTGYDADHNGIGDYTHESQRLFESFLDREPKLRILLFSPAQQAVEFVGRALPAIQPEPKFTDPFPLMNPVAVGPAGKAGPVRAGWMGGADSLGLAAAGLSGLAIVIGLAAFAGDLRRAIARRRATKSNHVLATTGGIQ